MERDYDLGLYTAEQVISTHTLTWSVTGVGGMTWGDADISTHTLTWSVTMFTGLYARQIYDFNSHAHVERDL